jgi:hypothetical protein
VDDPQPAHALNPDVPPALSDLVRRMLAKRPEDRPQSADEVAHLLRAIRRGPAGEPDSEGGVGDPVPPAVSAPIPVTGYEANAFAGLDDPAPAADAAAAKPARDRGGSGLWVGVAVAVVAAVGVGYVGLTQFRAPPPPADPPGRTSIPEPRAAAPKPPRPADPDRAAAEWVLKQGADALVTVNGIDVNDPAKLPAGPLRLTRVIFSTPRTGVREADLDRFQHLDSLDALHLGTDSDITDKGLERLAGFPFAAGLTNLAVRCPAATEAGLAHLARFVNLQHLHLVGPHRPTPAGLAHLGRLAELNALVIEDATLPGGGLAPLRGTKLTALHLNRCQVPDDGLTGLRDIPTLASLNFNEARLTGSALRPLAGHPALSALGFGSNSTVPDDALAVVRDLPALNNLYFHYTGVGDPGIAHLAGLTGLRNLTLVNTRLTDASLPVIAGLTGLESLDLGSPTVTDDWLRRLTGLTRLASLALRGARITDGGLGHLAGFARLHSLYLEGTAVTDTGLAKLAKVKALRNLNVSQTKVTADGVKQFKAALPECHVQSDFDPPK